MLRIHINIFDRQLKSMFDWKHNIHILGVCPSKNDGI